MSAAGTPHGQKSTLLSVRLKERIARNGPMSVADYMEACLADKEVGYYPSRQPIGGEGDFITAPEVSQIFGELLGLWAVAAWRSMDESPSLGRAAERSWRMRCAPGEASPTSSPV